MADHAVKSKHYICSFVCCQLKLLCSLVLNMAFSFSTLYYFVQLKLSGTCEEPKVKQNKIKKKKKTAGGSYFSPPW